ncbi:MAG: YceI family protein [Pseudobdellovibrionaceae bacterium]
MKITAKFMVLFVALISFSAWAENPRVLLAFKLSPAGSFQAESTAIKGSATKVGDKITAKGITLQLDSLKTGMELRDDHMKNKYLEVKKYPTAELITAEGSGGKGKATLKIRDVQKQVEGTYELLAGGLLKANFTFNLKDFNVTGVKHLGVGVKDEVAATVIVSVTGK